MNDEEVQKLKQNDRVWHRNIKRFGTVNSVRGETVTVFFDGGGVLRGQVGDREFGLLDMIQSGYDPTPCTKPLFKKVLIIWGDDIESVNTAVALAEQAANETPGIKAFQKSGRAVEVYEVASDPDFGPVVEETFNKDR